MSHGFRLTKDLPNDIRLPNRSGYLNTYYTIASATDDLRVITGESVTHLPLTGHRVVTPACSDPISVSRSSLKHLRFLLGIFMALNFL